MVIIASTANTNIHQLQNFNSQNKNNNIFHDASFSSYLNNNEGTFSESSKNFNRKDPIHHGINKEEDGEIGVFSAEKYFNGGGRVEEQEVILSTRVSEMDSKKHQHNNNHKKEEEKRVVETGRYKGSSSSNNKYGTPSVGSESSWNSQSALLQNSVMMRESSRNKNKSYRKSFLAGLGCKCYCSDKNSVDVSDHVGEVRYNCKKGSSYGLDHGKTAPKKLINADIDSNHSGKTTKQNHAELKDVYFQKQEKQFGVGLNRENNGLQFSAVKMQIQELEKPKKSLEVFGSPILESRISSNKKSMSFDKRLAMPNSWDGPKKLDNEIDIAENSGGGGGNYNDAESDASSDLFEIESLTGKSNNPFLSRPISSSCDVASGCASPTNCYAPSEASIEWSVVTASAVEYSAMSDYDDQRSVATIRSPIRPPLPSSNGKPKGNIKDIAPRRRPGMLLGCKSQKAVGVAADAFTTCERPSTNRQTRRRSDTFSQVTRFQEEAKEANFGARHGQHANYANIAAPTLQRSHSPHTSQLLYI